MAVKDDASLSVAWQFVAAINRHDVEALAAKMTEDHLFIDSLGNETQGRFSMEAGWKSYFGLFPDYEIELSGAAISGDTVLMHGHASGSLANSGGTGRWKLPAAWRAVITDGKVAVWQVFADNKPVYEILSRR